MIRSQCSGERVRIPANAVAAANNHVLARPVGHSDPRRKKLLAALHAQVVRHIADPTDVYLIVYRVITLKTAVGASRHREVLPTHAEVQRQLLVYLPAVAHIEAISPRPGGIRKNV